MSDKFYHRDRRARLLAADPDWIKKQNRLPKMRFSNAKSKAKIRQLEWSITFEEWCAIVSLPCSYCGGPLEEAGGGMDRLDNRKGYKLYNVVPCCIRCNRIKGRLEQIGFTYPRSAQLLREAIAP